MESDEVLAQAAAAWDKLETHLIEQCGLPNGAELEAARAGMIAIIVDCIRGELVIEVKPHDELLDLGPLDLGPPVEPDPLPPIDRRPVSWWKNRVTPEPVPSEQARWNRHLDNAVQGYSGDDGVTYGSKS